MLWTLGALALAALIMLALVGCNTYLRYQGWAVDRVEPQELSRLLRPAYDVRLPEGAGPWPTALLISGCDGPKDNLDRWAGMLNAAGWGAVIVDSHGPRGYNDTPLWRLICAGQLLTGGERAGDIAVAIEDMRAIEAVDADNLVLIGASHGGWAILDLLSLRGQDRLPFNLTRWPEGIAERGFPGLRGAILLYPYCGAGSQVSRQPWRDPVPALFLLVEGDAIADEGACRAVADRMERLGLPVEVHMLEGTTHGFDQAEKSALSTLEFSPEATEQALRIGADFLARVGPET